MISSRSTSLLVDMSPDLRQQLLNYGSHRVDGVFLTHVHFDHVNGINELRPLFFESSESLQVYGRKDVMDIFRECFFYLFKPYGGKNSIHKPYISTNVVDNEFVIGDIGGICFEQDHGDSKSTGLRIGNFAYTTDVVSLDDHTISLLQGLDVWVVDCTSREQRPSHANLEQVLKWAEILQPKMTFLTHMSISMDYETMLKELPDHIRPAYDQMEIML
jgi:phosphoribosyl 1,2-cyclic phosphate phosphodiesterase